MDITGYLILRNNGTHKIILKDKQMKKLITLSILLIAINLIAQESPPQIIMEEDPSWQNYFGSSGDIDGDYAAVTGVHSQNPNSSRGGIVNIYKQNEKGVWTLTRTMFPKIANAQDRFGQNACALSGNNVIVGDWMNNNQKIGAAHVFNFSGDTTWQQTAYLAPIDTTGVKFFGKSVDIYDKYAVVGSSESVYIFELQKDETWKQIKKLTVKNSSGFGQQVSIHGDFLLVSSQWETVEGIETAGVVYVYHNDINDGWKFFQRIHAKIEDVRKSGKFGASIAIYKNNIVIGYPKGKMGEIFAGNVYLFERNDDRFEFKQKLYASDFGQEKYRFGEQVSISENYIAVGEAQGRNHEGSVYVFEKMDDEFKEVNRLKTGFSTYYGNDFGQNGLSLSNNSLFVGFPGDDFCNEREKGCGSAYFYELEKTLPRKKTPPFVPKRLTKENIAQKMNQHNADSILFDYINADDVYNLRSSTTGLWGMYRSGKELIPMKYEHIDFYGWNEPFTFVKKEGKWCIYYGGFNNENQKIFCGYEELKKFEHKNFLYVAGKQNGKWKWVNWYNGHSTQDSKSYHQELTIYNNWNPGNYDNFKVD